MKILLGLVLLVVAGCSSGATGSYSITATLYNSTDKKCIVVTETPAYSSIATGVYCLADVKQ